MNCSGHAVVYSKPNCPQCDAAKAILEANRICFDVKVVGQDVTMEDLFADVGLVRSVPQMRLNGVHISSVEALRTAMATKDITL